MNQRIQGICALVGRATRAARLLASVAVLLGVVASITVAMPGMKPDSTAVPDTTVQPLPKMSPLPMAPSTPADLSKARKLKEVTLIVRHRVFHDFAEQITTRLTAPFPISDTDYSATVDRYVPDFAMDFKNGRVISRTAETNNPAVRVIIREKGVATDTTWALLDMPPHFGRKSMLAFQLTRLDYASGKPIIAKTAVPAGGKAK
jgi:hypothetical protein